jgi:recombination protein RecA
VSKETKEIDPIAEVIKNLNKEYGDGTLMIYDQMPEKIEVISTGSLNLDQALGIGGVPRGRIIEIFGAESSGKTTICLHIIANCQKAGGKAAFIDTEHSLDPIYSESLGVKMNELIVAQPEYAEMALEVVDALVRTNKVDCIVIDSVAGLVPKVELEGEYGQSHMGVQARLMSKAMRKLAGIISTSKCCVIFTNQIRMKIGVMFGNPETTPGGEALKFYASVRMSVSSKKIKSEEKGVTPIANTVKVNVIKNKLASPFKVAEFELIYGQGIDYFGELVDLGSALNIIEKSGTWYSYAGERLGQGSDNVKILLKSKPELAEEIYKKILEVRKSV